MTAAAPAKLEKNERCYCCKRKAVLLDVDNFPLCLECNKAVHTKKKPKTTK